MFFARHRHAIIVGSMQLKQVSVKEINIYRYGAVGRQEVYHTVYLARKIIFSVNAPAALTNAMVDH